MISNLLFYGHDGTDYANAAGMIRVECDGTVAGNQMPGAMSFHTNGGSTSATERLRIDSDGNLHIKGTNHATRYYRDDDARYGSIFYNGSNFAIRQPNGDNLQIEKFDGTVLGKFYTDGSLSVGHATPQRRLHVKLSLIHI